MLIFMGEMLQEFATIVYQAIFIIAIIWELYQESGKLLQEELV